MVSAKKVATTIILALTGLGLVGVIAATLPLLGCDGQLINLAMPQSSSREIRPGNEIRQSFVATAADLTRIEVYVQTFFRRNTQDVVMTLLELPPDASPLNKGTVRFQTQFNAADLPGPGWYAVEFEPLPKSAGRQFVLHLESPGSKPGDAVTVGGVLAADPYRAGAVFVGSTRLDGDIAFRVCYRMTLGEKLEDLAGQLTLGRSGVWGMAPFYLFLGLLYLLLMAALLWHLARLP